MVLVYKKIKIYKQDMGLITEFIAYFLIFFMIVTLLSWSTIQNQYDPTLTYNNVLSTIVIVIIPSSRDFFSRRLIVLR